jgi:REP element-mobilizing transposase RayT
MSRPLRIEFAGALYHVTSRGDRREDIYVDDVDRTMWLNVLEQVCHRFNWAVHAYCLMSNHYHVLVQTPEGNLSGGMRQLNGVYTQRANQRHRRVGHVFQGRFKAVLVDREAHLLELARYVVLNPVRAGIVADARAWRWSSYRATLGDEPAPAWLEVDSLLAQFGTRRTIALRRYVDHVRAGIGLPSIWQQLNQQVYLGDDAFVARMQRKAGAGHREASEVPHGQRRPPAAPLTRYTELNLSRNTAMARAYASGAYTLGEVARAFGVHYSTVSRAVGRHESLRMVSKASRA